MDDILDEQTLALMKGKYAVTEISQALRPAASKYKNTVRETKAPSI